MAKSTTIISTCSTTACCLLALCVLQIASGCIMCAAATSSSSISDSSSDSSASSQHEPTNRFIRFYGSTPVPDRNLERMPSAWTVPLNEGTESWLSLLPTWPAIRAGASNNTVIPFVDEIVAVRVLGGWDSSVGHGGPADDIIDENLQFRWNLLDQRIDPWLVRANKSILFVLDNVPYVFTDGHPVLAHFGQSAPPSNYTQFEWFVREVVLHLQGRYGRETVANRFRFRVGTEPDGPRYGNVSQYFNSYAAAARAVKSVSPQSPIGAGNWLHQGQDYDADQAYELQFYRWAKESNVAVDFIAQSDYVQGVATPGGRRYPCFIANGSAKMSNYAATYGKATLPQEVMEFVPLRNREKRTSVEPGSFGVSFYVACWATALRSNIRRIFHWGTTHEPGVAGELWTGYGWAMGMAELLLGQTVVSIEVPSSCERGVYALAGTSATLATAFDPYRDASPFNLTYTLVHNVTKMYTMNSAVSPFDAMLREAKQLGYAQFKDGLPYGIHSLLNEAGKRWIRKPAVWERFMAMQKQAFAAEVVMLEAGSTIVIPSFTTVVLVEQ